MSVKTDKVKSGYAELDSQERQEIKDFIKDFDASDQSRRINLSEQARRTFSKKSLGPTSGSNCPCCGN